MEQMLAGLSACRYHVGLEPIGEQAAEKATATSKLAISRRFVRPPSTPWPTGRTRTYPGFRIVPVEQSRKLVDRLRTAGADVDYLEVPGADHVWRGAASVPDIVDRSLDFLAARMRIN